MALRLGGCTVNTAPLLSEANMDLRPLVPTGKPPDERDEVSVALQSVFGCLSRTVDVLRRARLFRGFSQWLFVD